MNVYVIRSMIFTFRMHFRIFRHCFQLCLTWLSRILFLAYSDIVFMNEIQHNTNRMQNTVSPDSQQNIRKPFKHRSRTTGNTKTRKWNWKSFRLHFRCCAIFRCENLWRALCYVCTVHCANVTATYFVDLLVEFMCAENGEKQANAQRKGYDRYKANRHHQQIEVCTPRTQWLELHKMHRCTANAIWQISKFINLHLFSAWKDEWTDWRRVAILRHFLLLLFLSAQRKEYFQFHGKTTIQRSPDYNLCQLFRSFLFIFLIAPRSCSCFCAPSIFLLLIFLLPFYSWIVMLLAQAHSTYNIITEKHHQNVCGKNCLTFSFPIIQ